MSLTENIEKLTKSYMILFLTVLFSRLSGVSSVVLTGNSPHVNVSSVVLTGNSPHVNVSVVV